MFDTWMRVTRDAVLLGLETQRVIGLRLIKLSRGGRAAELEAVRMVTEKNTALAEAAMTVVRGGSAQTVDTALSNTCEIEHATLVEIPIVVTCHGALLDARWPIFFGDHWPRRNIPKSTRHSAKPQRYEIVTRNAIGAKHRVATTV
jgi:hypothetical protein